MKNNKNVTVGLDADMETKAIILVARYIKEHLDKSDGEVYFDVYTVWKCKTLQNWKFLISSSLNDGMYYEVTYNGYKDGVNDGRNEAWEAARKVILSPDEGGTSLLDLVAIFGDGSMQRIFRNYSASEVIAKLKAYEEKQKADEDGKAANDKGCEGCEYAGKVVTDLPCISCCNSYKNQWTAKEKK